MAPAPVIDSKKILGRSPESLTLVERQALVGRWIALEIYTPTTLPLRQIEAVGESATECIRQLRERGLDPKNFEFLTLGPAY
jgi:hypothetical protein